VKFIKLNFNKVFHIVAPDNVVSGTW